MLRAKHPGWEVTSWETGVGVLMWSAFWQSSDGARRVYRVAGSAGELEVKLTDYAWNGVPGESAAEHG
jgi:hypothetical protein